MIKQTKKSLNGTSFFDVTFMSTPKKLKKLFPNSYQEHNDGSDKTNFDFELETEKGNVFSIYDWKEYRKLKMNETIEWHIGAFGRSQSIDALHELNQLLEK